MPVELALWRLFSLATAYMAAGYFPYACAI
jgi:hypothetical protein